MNTGYDVFELPELLHLLWLLPLVIVGIYFTREKELRLFSAFSENWKKIVAHRYSRSSGLLRSSSLILCFVAIVFALARPRLGYVWEEKQTGGVDVLVAVDISKSMLASDLSPNRLERAKREIKDLLRILQGDRIGFLPFSGRAFIHLPLTADYKKMAELFLENIDYELISVGGTNISEALNLATNSLTKSAAHKSQGKAVILITDGEDHSGKLFEAAENAREKGIRVFVVGIGSPEGAPLQLPGGGFLKDKSGNVVVSKLAETDLVKVAEITGGLYVRSVAGDIDLEKIYQDGIKSSGSDNDYGVMRQKIWNEAFQWPVGAAIIFLLLGFVFTPYRKKTIVVLFFGLAGLSSNQSFGEVFSGKSESFKKGLPYLRIENSMMLKPNFQKI